MFCPHRNRTHTIAISTGTQQSSGGKDARKSAKKGSRCSGVVFGQPYIGYLLLFFPLNIT